MAKHEETLTITRKFFEELCRKVRLLEFLEAAGIDNCEAYSEGYRAFLQQEDEDDE